MAAHCDIVVRLMDFSHSSFTSICPKNVNCYHYSITALPNILNPFARRRHSIRFWPVWRPHEILYCPWPSHLSVRPAWPNLTSESFSAWARVNVNAFAVTLVARYAVLSVASLGLVSPGAATDGVTLSSCKKLTFFSHHLTACEEWWPFLPVVSLPPRVTPSMGSQSHPTKINFFVAEFRKTTKFSHKKNNFTHVSLPWRVSPGAVRPCPPSDTTVSWCGSTYEKTDFRLQQFYADK